MYELICPTAKDQKLLIEQIREAVDVCPTEYETSGSEFEEKKIEEARKAKVRELLNSMYEKDAKIAQTCEDKMKVFADIMVSPNLNDHRLISRLSSSSLILI